MSDKNMFPPPQEGTGIPLEQPQIQQPQTNPLASYFRQPKIYITLPSKGMFWTKDSIEMTANGELPVFAMTAKDEILLKTPDALISGQATVDVIQSCIPAIKDAWKMPVIDLDSILIAIRIATYGEKMDLEINVPVTAEQKRYDLDLRQILDQHREQTFEPQVKMGPMLVTIKPLNYEEFTKTALKTFEEQRIFNVLNNDQISDAEKITVFQKSFKALTDITIKNLENAIYSIQLDDGTVVDNPQHISEFVNNAEKDTFTVITDHIEAQRNKFTTKPLVLQATPEEIEKGVPETYEVPISFDSANFFVSGS